MKRRVGVAKAVRVFAGALLVVAGLFAVAACGGGGSTDGSSSSEGTNVSAPAITKAELIRKADAICRKTDEVQRRVVGAYVKKHGQVELTDNPEMRKVTKTLLMPPIGAELREITALGAPPGDEAEVAAIIKGLERALDATLKNPSVLLASTGEGPFAKPDKRAGDYGFKDCAKAL